MARSDARLRVGLLAATAVWSLAIALLGSHDGVLFLAPALLLGLPLAFGRYFGETRLAGARGRRSPRAARSRSDDAPAAARSFAAAPSGGLLLAAGLATRPPPPLASRA